MNCSLHTFSAEHLPTSLTNRDNRNSLFCSVLEKQSVGFAYFRGWGERGKADLLSSHGSRYQPRGALAAQAVPANRHYQELCDKEHFQRRIKRNFQNQTFKAYRIKFCLKSSYLKYIWNSMVYLFLLHLPTQNSSQPAANPYHPSKANQPVLLPRLCSIKKKAERTHRLRNGAIHIPRGAWEFDSSNCS